MTKVRGPFFISALMGMALFAQAQANCRVFSVDRSIESSDSSPRFSRSRYDSWKGRWEFFLESRSDLFEILRSQNAWHGETLIALLDVINKESHLDLVESIRNIEAQGDHVEFRTYWFSRGLKGRRDPQFKLKWFFGLNRKVIIYIPKLAPRNPEELADSLQVIAMALTSYRLKKAGRRAPLTTLPVGSWQASYPQRAMDVVLDSVARLYSGLLALENLFPEWTADLPRRDRTWKYLFEELTFATGWRFLFPFFYDPFKKASPNEEDFGRFKSDVEKWISEDRPFDGFLVGLAQRFPDLNEALNQKFRYRTRLKWASDRWRDFIIVSSLVGIIRYVPAAYEFVASGKIQQIFKQIEDLEESARPENINKALEHYEGTLAWKFYGPKIEALQKDIKENGDFDGSKRHELKGLIERLEKLR